MAEDLNAKNGWRPMNAWVFIYLIVLFSGVISFLLITDKVKFIDAAATIMVLIGASGGNTGLYTHGRTKERLAGKLNELTNNTDEE